MSGGTSPRFHSTTRRVFDPMSQDAVDTAGLFPGTEFGLLIRPRCAGQDLIAWCGGHGGHVKFLVERHGAVLFRGFDVPTARDLERLIETLYGEALEYQNRASPRHRVEENTNIYTSTDYPASQEIFLHNEHSYSPVFPGKLFFHARVPPERGGQTPIGSVRDLTRLIPGEVAARFRDKGVRYVRNYNNGFGLDWQTAFNTDNREEVERYCHQHGIRFEWKDGDRLRTSHHGPALVRHPSTGEHLWFNHATFFHLTTLPEDLAAGIRGSLAEEDYPTNTYYGDGEPIADDTLECLRTAYKSVERAFDWHENDVLLLDNLLTVHGRKPYSGKRSIIVGMAQATLQASVALQPT